MYHHKTIVTIKLDTRRFSKKNNGYHIKIRLYHKQKETFIQTGYYSSKANWVFLDLENAEYIESLQKQQPIYVSNKHRSARRINTNINTKLSVAQQFLLSNEHRLKSYSLDELKQVLAKVVNDFSSEGDLDSMLTSSISLVEAFEKKIKETTVDEAWSTRGNYEESLKRFKEYFAYINIEDIELASIDAEWLDKFQTWYKMRKNHFGEKIKPNTINKKLGQLRHLMRRACKDKSEKMTWNDNPFFNDYKIPKNKTGKRALEISKLDQGKLHEKFNMNEVANIMDLFRQIKLKSDTLKWHTRNYMLFMWNCRGMDLVDLAFLTRDKIENGVLEYHRSKVKGESLITIDLNEEALEILNYYDYQNKTPRELVFPLMYPYYEPSKGITEQVYGKYRAKRSSFNATLTALGKEVGLEGSFTSKMIRHTWAQLGFNETGNRGLIGEGLGHANDSTTRIYAKELDRRKIRDANESITQRKSKIASYDYELEIDLTSYFGEEGMAEQEADTLQKTILKEIHSYTPKVYKILVKKREKSEWEAKLSELSNQHFRSHGEVSDWLQGHLQPFCHHHRLELLL